MSDANLYKGINHHLIKVFDRKKGDVNFVVYESVSEKAIAQIFPFLALILTSAIAILAFFSILLLVIKTATFLGIPSNGITKVIAFGVLFGGTFYITRRASRYIRSRLDTPIRSKEGAKSAKRNFLISANSNAVTYLGNVITSSEWGGFRLNQNYTDGRDRQSGEVRFCNVDVVINGVAYPSGFIVQQDEFVSVDIVNQANMLVAEGLQITEPITGGGSLAVNAGNDGDWE